MPVGKLSSLNCPKKGTSLIVTYLWKCGIIYNIWTYPYVFIGKMVMEEQHHGQEH